MHMSSVALASLAALGPQQQVGEELAAARKQWERQHGRMWPGRPGDELHCGWPLRTVKEMRREWAEKALTKAAQATGKPLSELSGLEVGACGAPTELPAGVGVTFVDFSNKTETQKQQCVAGKSSVRASIIDDAQHMASLANSTTDFVIGNHVLEHMNDFLGAVAAWLRVTRVGGVVMFALPEPCDPSWNVGESMRLAARPEHYLQEYELGRVHPKRVRRHDDEHAVMSLGMLHSARGRSFLRESCKRRQDAGKDADTPWGIIDCANQHRWLPSDGITRGDEEEPGRWLRIADFYPEGLDMFARRARKRPENGHRHVWTPQSLQTTLNMATRVFDPSSAFVLRDFYVAARSFYVHREYRVVLQRVAPN